MGYLLLVRHGESRFNTVNKFTGWVDVPLSEKGVKEALMISKRIKPLRLDMAFTSHLERAHETLLIILAHQHFTGIFEHSRSHAGFDYPISVQRKDEIPVYTSWKLNERNYGLLQGLDKEQAARKYGYKKVSEWRRGFTEKPPQGESLKDVYKRVVPYFKRNILKRVHEGQNVLVVAHGNTLRAIIKYLDNIPDHKMPSLELNPGKPFIYKSANGKLVKNFEGYSFTRPITW